jgi:broad specificity phosphatase PhoE
VTRLILCRHAEAGNSGQAGELAASLRTEPVRAVFSSPIVRARETADAVAAVHSLAVVEVRGLREIDFGEVDGVAFDELPDALQAALLDAPTEVRFPGGETYAELQERVATALGEIVRDHPEATVVAVSHAGAIRAALAAWLGITGEAVFRIDQRYASVNIVDWIGGTPVFRLINGSGMC